MTLNKSITEKIESPKKAALGTSCDLSKSCLQKAIKATNSDREIQSLKKRRYMRRGSKTPNMLLQAFPFMNLGKVDFPASTVGTSGAAVRQRRLSIVSALRLSLEASAIYDSPRKTEKRSLLKEEKRRVTIDILSQVDP